MEAMEERLLLSKAELTTIVLAANVDRVVASTTTPIVEAAHHQGLGAHILRFPKSSTLLTVAPAGGVAGGTVTLKATLTSSGVPVAGQVVRFKIKGRAVGNALTDNKGVATLSNVRLKGLRVGSYSTGASASVTSTLTHARSTQKGVLTVSRFASSLSGVSASGVFGGSGNFTATLASSGVALPGQVINFALNDRYVGSATTNSQGIASLSNVSLAGVKSGAYPTAITATYAGGVTYAQNSLTGNLTVSRAQAGITLGGLSRTFDGSAQGVTVATNPGGLATTISYTDSSGNPVASPTAAGAYHVLATVSDPNYSGSASGDLLIKPHSQPITLRGLNQTYDGTAKSVTVTTSPGDLAYTVSYTNSNGNPVAHPTAAGSYQVSATITTPNYTGSATGTLVISPAAVSVHGITAASKMYDGSTTATLDTSGATLVGLVAGDQVTLNAGSASGTFAGKDAGTGKTVTVSNLSLSGPAAANYTLAATTTTANITTATVIVSGLTASDKVYDGTTAATLHTSGATLEGVVAGDQVSLNTSNASATFENSAAGTDKAVNATGLSLTGPDAGNYLLTATSATGNITPAPLTVTGITAGNKVYDGSNQATLDTANAALVGKIAGDDVVLATGTITGTFASKNAGTGKLVAVAGLSLTGGAAGNYVLTEPAITADITPATVTVTGITASNKTYDGTTDATLDAGSALLDGVLSGDQVTLDASHGAGTFDTKDVGSGKPVTITGLALTGADAGNYVFTPPTTTAEITAATLTIAGITASNKVYDGTTGATLDTAGAMLVGKVGGDDVTLDDGAATGTFATKDVGAGQLLTLAGLSLSGADAGNYTLTLPATTADITPAVLTVTGITAGNKVYDGTTGATLNISGPALVGVVTGEDVTLDSSSLTGTFDGKDVGTGKAVTVTGLALMGADIGNYILTAPTPTANITALALTVTGITASDKTYDGTTSATIETSGAALVGALTGDDVTLDANQATGTFDTKGVGSARTVTITGLTLSGSDAGNYVITPPTTSADITPASLTVTGLTANDKTYDGTTAATLNATGAALTGAVPGDDVTLDTANVTGTFDTKDVGSDKTVVVSGLVLAGNDAGNYVLTAPTSTASVAAATLSVTGITAEDKAFDGTTDATLDTTNALLDGVVTGDTVTLEVAGAVGTFDTPDVDINKTVFITGLTITGADSGNYTLAQPTTSASIT
jgi:hypothetical protein